MGRTRKKKLFVFCHLKQNDVKDIHVGQETGLLVDSSTVLAILYVKCSMRMKPSSEVYFARIAQVSSHSLNLCTAAVNLDLNGHPVHTTRMNSPYVRVVWTGCPFMSKVELYKNY